MPGTQHAFDFLTTSPAEPLPGVCAVFGDQPFLRRQVLRQLRARLEGDGQHDTWLEQFDGNEVEWRDVLDELSTASLFGGGRRLVIVQDADDFVSARRGELEQLVEHPRRSGTLVLVVGSWASNTRLYKLLDKSGWQIDCRLPSQPRSKSVDLRRTVRWLQQCGKGHQVKFERGAVELLWELAGPDLGRVDQETAKLALFASGGRVDEALVREVVGGWKTMSTWEMIDAATEGDAGEALRQLDRLLASGERPHALFGQISWSLRRFATASQTYQRAKRHGQRLGLPAVLEQAGFRKWPAGALEKAEQRMKRMGRGRVDRFYRWLLETDLALKGTHSSDSRARWALEHLLVRISAEPLTNEPRPTRRGGSSSP